MDSTGDLVLFFLQVLTQTLRLASFVVMPAQDSDNRQAYEHLP